MTRRRRGDPRKAAVIDGLTAGAVAALVSGAPSTIHAVMTDRDPLAATKAAGSLLSGAQARRGSALAAAGAGTAPLLAAGAVAHLGLSLGWGIVLSAVLPRRHTALWGALAGAAIAALDLGLIGRRFPRIAALPLAPQVADHIAYGTAVGAVLAHCRRPS